MDRRTFFAGAAAAANSLLQTSGIAAALPAMSAATSSPSDASWDELSKLVEGRLLKFDLAAASSRTTNPFAIRDDPWMTQNAGWVGAWKPEPSSHVVIARNAADVVAAVNFARTNGIRIAVKGAGHSYLGTSSASANSLLVWTRHINEIQLEPAFVSQGSEAASVPAVHIGGGAVWLEAYHAVTTLGGRYVQGGGCTTVGVAGHVQSGGFGSFSKRFGLSSSNLLEAEVVLADGRVVIANPFLYPDLFRALKGGGGGTFGVVIRLVLQTHDLPTTFGGVSATIQAASDENYRELLAQIVSFYAERLHGEVWGEQIVIERGNVLAIRMVFQGLSKAEAEATWRPFFDAVRQRPDAFRFVDAPIVVAAPARAFWDARVLDRIPGLIVRDDRQGALPQNFSWAGDAAEAGRTIEALRSRWLPASLLAPERRSTLVEALLAASRHWRVELHTNKGLHAASAEVLDAVRETSMNPAVESAFALAIIASTSTSTAASDAAFNKARVSAVASAMAPLERLGGPTGSYPSEMDYFAGDWAVAAWGSNFTFLKEVKRQYDRDNLFAVHHGVLA